MTYLLDTNACIQHLRSGPQSSVAFRLREERPGNVVLCSIVVAELHYGARRSGQPARNLADVRRFCGGFVSLPFDDAAAEEYGEIRAELQELGTPIGPNDLMIAAVARVHGLTLVTHNVAEFSRVAGRHWEDWQQP